MERGQQIGKQKREELTEKRPGLHRSNDPIPFPWRPAHEYISNLLFRFHYLTAPQINFLFGRSKSSGTHTQSEVSEMFHGHFINAFWQSPSMGSAMNTHPGIPRTYHLDRKGREYLKKLGHSISGLPDDSGPTLNELLQYQDYMDATNAIISCFRLSQQFPEIELTAYWTKYELRRMLKNARYDIPDGWTSLYTATSNHNLTWEVDRGKETQRTTTAKIARYLAWRELPYIEGFDLRNLTVLFTVTSGGETHAGKVLEWVEKALIQAQRRNAASLFRIAVCDFSLDPQQLFLSPIWSTPFSDKQTSLLDQEQNKFKTKAQLRNSTEYRARVKSRGGWILLSIPELPELDELLDQDRNEGVSVTDADEYFRKLME